MTGALTGTTLGYYANISLALVMMRLYFFAKLFDVSFWERLALEKILYLFVKTGNINILHIILNELIIIKEGF
jgi:hypothetical protein